MFLPLSLLAALSLVLLLCVGALLWARWPRKKKPVPLPAEWALTPRPVFNSDERRVYRLLREALPHHIVLSKLPLVRFCQPLDAQQVRYWYDLLGTAHVTFAVCSANGKVLAAIDLDNERGASRRTLQIKQAVMGACGVRYMRCPLEQLPSVAELQMLVPQAAAPARGPQPAPVMSHASHQLSHTVAERRRARTALWQDSGFFQDSFFASDPRLESRLSEFGTLGSASSRAGAPSTLPPEEGGGMVIDTPGYASHAGSSVTRH
ncbi:Protein of unknown function (DUF2726) [Burkholderiales bacterium JOSHI_001]|nr:Protein of unknown function (DUF2726) [Burkholderiales bacterium JOSHI_001]